MEPEREPQAQNGGSGKGIHQRFVDAYCAYARELTGAWASQELQQRSATVYRGYLTALQEMRMPPGVQDQASEAYRNFMRTLQEPIATEAAQEDVARAYRSYVQVLQQAYSPLTAQQRAIEAYQNYIRGLGAALAPEEVQRGMSEAYRHYVGALQDAWSQASPEALDTNALMAISQSMSAAARLTATAREALRQRHMAAAYMEAAAPPNQQSRPTRESQ